MGRKKNVLLVTLFDNNNIGNRLQNYALYHLLEAHNVNVVTLDNCYTTQPSFKHIIKMQLKGILGIFVNRKYLDEYNQFCVTNNIRKANKNFNKKNIKNVIRITNNQEAFERKWTEFDIAIAGSDQIWHKWHDDVNELPFYYLEFMPKEKRFSYAASFGFEQIPSNDLQQHKVGLNGMKLISCREKTGCNIVRDILKRDVPKVLDPTLLLSPLEWKEIAGQASNVVKEQSNYAFVYFLGDVIEEYKKYMKETVKSLKIINIIDFSDNNRMISKCGPSEFLSLIENADYIFTDSFHCTVFSTLFNKKFTVFRRIQPGFEKMFSRLEEFLSSKGLLDHIYGGTQVEASNDFDELFRYSISFLEKILELNNEDREN
ncbi:polysaccharide pyruvyl transferase family protein [Lacrimispora sp. JR3]|uniref:polysaccharide pyruvyl transferase family protein n=1 Tax=Lacrimispora sinapis TaxID=3111456 RepID=UPI003749C34A